MGSLVKPRLAGPPTAWTEAARALSRWLAEGERVDRLLEGLPRALSGVERARSQHLILGVVRHAGRLDAALRRVVAHPPRFITRAALYLAGFELIQGGTPDATPKIVHHAVDQARELASPAEARLVNAVLRRLAPALASEPAPPRLASAATLAEYYSHPEWLVRRWLAQHGAASTQALLEWNQRPGVVHARVRPGAGHAEALPEGLLQPTPWPDFFEVASGHWAEIERLASAGRIYLQDPASRIPVDLLAPRPGEAVLDLCAAPGGKTLLIADRQAAAAQDSPPPRSLLVAMDLPGPRMGRLTENLSRVGAIDVRLVQGDLLEHPDRILAQAGLPTEYPAVLLDAPCSNTGVMRHRVDVKWRLQEADFSRHACQQLALLASAARLVAPGGRLVYSTCSIDPEENEGVAAAFLRQAPNFSLEARKLSYPWTAGHDGGAAFRFVQGTRSSTAIRLSTSRAP